jgi:TonB family protein
VRGAPTASTENETFRRAARTAELRPEPQSLAAFEDRISARLAAMERNTPTPVRGTSVTALTSSAWGSPAQAGTVPGSGASPLSLHRGGGASSGPALPLTRGGGGIAPAVVATGLPSGVTEASRAARGGDAEAHRQLAGATLAGPIADRPVVSMVRPTYPEWAKRDAVEGSVTLYFIVRPDGSVLDNVLVQKTAGFEDFDESARAALRAWRFAALREGRTGEQWGTITFHFRLQEAG